MCTIIPRDTSGFSAETALRTSNDYDSNMLVIGGVYINTGPIPSKTLHEAAMQLFGYREGNIYGASYAVKADITMQYLLFPSDRLFLSQ